jgi:hypothetical protein
VKIDRLPLIWLALSGAATVFILIQWLILPDDGGIGDFGGGILGDTGIDSGAGFGLVIGLILALASTVAAFLTFRSAPKTVPGSNPATAG